MSIQTAGPVVPEWTLGDRMRKALERNGFSVQRAAEQFGVTRGTIGNWLHDRVPVSKANKFAWATWTGVPYTWLETGQVPADGPGPDGVAGGGFEPPTSGL